MLFEDNDTVAEPSENACFLQEVSGLKGAAQLDLLATWRGQLSVRVECSQCYVASRVVMQYDCLLSR